MTSANGQTDDKDEKPENPSQSTFIYLIIKLRDVKDPPSLPPPPKKKEKRKKEKSPEKSRGRKPRWCGQPFSGLDGLSVRRDLNAGIPRWCLRILTSMD